MHVSRAEEMIHSQSPLRSARSSFYCNGVLLFETHVVYQKFVLYDLTGSLVM